MIEVLYKIKECFDNGHHEVTVNIAKNELNVRKHRYYSGKPYFSFYHINELEKIERKYNIEILLKANKSTYTIAISEKQRNLFDFGKREDFRVDESEIEELEERLLSICLPIHILESIKKAMKYSKELEELSKRPEFDELIKRGIIHDPPETIAEEEIEFRAKNIREQARRMGIIIQKLRYLGIPYQIRTYPLAEMLRVPAHDIIIKQRILKVSDVRFLTKDEGLLRIHFEPYNFNWLWTFF